MRYAVAHGRRAGVTRGRSVALAERAVAELRGDGHEVVEVIAAHVDEARSTCRALVADGLDVLVVAGGDGAVSMGTDVCAGSRTALAVLPGGTGNDNARSLGLPLGDADAALRTLRAHRTRTVDTLHLPDLDRHALASVCCALDARIAGRADGWPRALGSVSYTLSALVEIALLRRQPPLRFRLAVDGGPAQELEALVLVPANMPFFGGGLPIAPDADPADGLLDLVQVRPVTPAEALGVLRAVRAGRHTSHPAVRISRAQSVHVEGPADLAAHADGEPVAPLPLTVETDPSSLRVVVPG